MSTNSGTDPTVIITSPVGYPVTLGELYDQRSAKFLGAHLYPERKTKVVETDIKHTDLTLSLSDTLESKSSKLNIDAKVTLSFLGGLIKISGSAGYMKETRSNLREQSYALALKIRLREQRILFAEDAMARNILDVAVRDYFLNGKATHFVSGITYGGNLVINLVARQVSFTSQEKLSGSLSWMLRPLKGAISLKADADKDRFRRLGNKFDLTVYGDVALEKLPTTPQEVLDVIPSAAQLIQKDGGVPISVTLQPIPKSLQSLANAVYEVDKLLIDQVLAAFSLLDDLRCRFAVLVDDVGEATNIVPELTRTITTVRNQFTREHGVLLLELNKFLDEYQHGNPLPPGFEGSNKDEIPVLKTAGELYKRHIELDDESYKPSQYYPSTLVGLEAELSRYWNFVTDIQDLGSSVLSLAESCKQFVRLSSISDVNSVIKLQNKISLFVMTSFAPKQPRQPSADKLHPDLAIVQFLSTLREYDTYFNNSTTPARMLYAETLELQRRLPSLGKYADFDNPFFIIGRVDSGQVSWSDPPLMTALSLKLRHESRTRVRSDFSYAVESVNGRESFSIQVWATPSSSTSPHKAAICILQSRMTGNTVLEFQINPLTAKIERVWGAAALESLKEPPANALFAATLVQDLASEEGPKWSLYLGEEEVYSALFGVGELLPDSISVQLVYPTEGTTWWNGVVSQVRAFSCALSKERIAEEIRNPPQTS